MRAILDRQRRAFLREGAPSAERRIELLDRAIRMLLDHKQDIADAISIDYGERAVCDTLIGDVLLPLGEFRHAKKHVRRWMRPERRSVEFPFGLLGARAWIHHQPKGVVGILAPWNFPVLLVFAPLAQVLAAGNRAMIKPSEITPVTADLIARMIREAYDEEEVAVVTGGAEMGAAFASLPLDHLVFTGGTEVGRAVARAAAANLVPTTLELGGKSPVVVSRSARLDRAVPAIMTAKLLNAGQVCVAPDYVFVPRDRMDAFVEEVRHAVGRMYPTLRDNPDYVSIVNQRHYDRLLGYLEDCRAKGATTIEINPAEEDFFGQRAHKLPPTLVIDPTDDMLVMREEIFGPILPVKGYDAFQEAIDYINAHDRPLELAYFGEDAREQETLIARTTSGGMTLHDVGAHVMVPDLPFGGIGPSGMGVHGGVHGFREFSNARAVYRQTKVRMVMEALRPPYTEKVRARIEQFIGK